MVVVGISQSRFNRRQISDSYGAPTAPVVGAPSGPAQISDGYGAPQGPVISGGGGGRPSNGGGRPSYGGSQNSGRPSRPSYRPPNNGGGGGKGKKPFDLGGLFGGLKNPFGGLGGGKPSYNGGNGGGGGKKPFKLPGLDFNLGGKLNLGGKFNLGGGGKPSYGAPSGGGGFGLPKPDLSGIKNIFGGIIGAKKVFYINKLLKQVHKPRKIRIILCDSCNKFLFIYLPTLPIITQPTPELQQRSLMILEERSVKSLLQVGNLYQSSTTLGLDPVSSGPPPN